tara:strand:- start:1377 stop:1724 length:348 start_codon:yes stop_codon:yes gene_type:complete
MKYVFIGLRVVLALVFLAAGGAKLAGAEMMVGTFQAIGLGEWFRYLTGALEVGAAILLWAPGRQLLASTVLLATMVGAVLAHLFILGPSLVPALVLGILCAIVAYHYNEQSLLSK